MKPTLRPLAKTLLLLDDLGRDIPIGVSRSGILCPFCGGGDANEKSMSISRTTTGILYICHRNKCKQQGARVFGPSVLDEGDLVKVGEDQVLKSPPRNGYLPKDKPYTKPLEPVPQPVVKVVERRWGLDDKLRYKWGVKWAPNEPAKDACGRLFIPCRNRADIVWGAVARSVDGDAPKAITHTFKENHCKMAYFRSIYHEMPENYIQTRNLIVVEDVLSAMRASRYMSAVALLGTSLSFEKMLDMHQFGADNVYLCLDFDAAATAVKLAIRYRTTLPLKIVNPRVDLKDMSEAELCMFIEDIERLDQHIPIAPYDKGRSEEDEQARVDKMVEEEAAKAALDKSKALVVKGPDDRDEITQRIA